MSLSVVPFAGAPSAAITPSVFPIIVHSHLNWDWVWQRPQQFLARLSKTHRILFVEGPRFENVDTSSFSVRNLEEYPNIWVMQNTIPAARWSDGAWVDAERLRLLREALSSTGNASAPTSSTTTASASSASAASGLKGKFEQPVQWFYDPMAVTSFAGNMNESAIVYDCMDELSQFKGAPKELIQRERQLLGVADVVFAGGRKMHESKSRYNDNCHFYGCGVDVAHFGKARSATTSIPDDIKDLSGPILGYFGVVDERMDLELVEKLADANRDWNVVMVGPVCKIDEKSLPQRANLHWLGGRDYSQLPAYTKAFDVCLMPFALNEATEYINPTKALEYMATAKPIVSSAVPDVVSNFSRVVQIAHSHDDFVVLCKVAVAQPNQELISRGLKMAHDNTWDAIVAKLEAHIEDVLTANSAQTEADEMAVSA